MQKTIPFDLKEAICTIIYAAPRVEIKELHEVRTQFLFKYGECAIQDAMENRGNCVNSKIVHKLSACAPENYLVFDYLNNIAKKYNVEWKCPYEETSPIFEEAVMIPPSIHQPMQPTAFAPPMQEPRFVPNGGQSVFPGTGFVSHSIPTSSFAFPSVPNGNGSSFPSVPNGNGSSFPSVPSYNNPPPYSPPNSNFNFPSVPPNNNPPPYSPPNSDFNFPSTPSNNGGFPSLPNNQSNNFDFPSTPNNGSSGDSDFDDLTARFNKLKKK